MWRRLSRITLVFVVTLLAVINIQSQDNPAGAATAGSPTTPTGQLYNTAQIAARTVVIVHEFSVNKKAGWPYDVKQLQSQTVAEFKAKSEADVDVLINSPETVRMHSYTLDGEIVSWHPGSRAKRMMVGMGSGRETAEIHYWLTDGQGNKVFEHKDTIRAEFWGNAYAGSVGELIHPFASKVAGRVRDAKLF